MLTQHDRVRAIETFREINKGDTGTIISGWEKTTIGIRWDKDGKLRTFNRKRLEKI